MYSLAITSKRYHLNLMVADHHKSRAMLISRQCERCTRREYSPASTRGHLRASTRGEYSRQCEIALTLTADYTYGTPYTNALYVADIPSLVDRREQLSRNFFKSVLKPILPVLYTSSRA